MLSIIGLRMSSCQPRLYSVARSHTTGCKLNSAGFPTLLLYPGDDILSYDDETQGPICE